ncbi:putative quinol monooxygenase [Curtobacterium sp. PhB146]|uniref:putative quinol monooxygenase n=1 Tax=Curtobacterium sp. PhB146 TaxID=2485187 RepID=UPI0010EDF89B|nr:putative quinol monooxygenase [Curtobacterium sp. PhB146]TCU45311.1 quinol monooxygenase YgiN [Curtobacterium sp. PhB146]
MSADIGARTVRVVAEAYIVPGRAEELHTLLLPLVSGTRDESGNISYAVIQDTANANHLLFLEEWATREAFASHLSAPHFLAYAAASEALLEQPARIVVAEPLAL